MPDKYATTSFQAFAKNEIGYRPSSPKCSDCVHFKLMAPPTGSNAKPLQVCDVLGKVGLIVVEPDGCCNLYEFRRTHCVPSGGA